MGGDFDGGEMTGFLLHMGPQQICPASSERPNPEQAKTHSFQEVRTPPMNVPVKDSQNTMKTQREKGNTEPPIEHQMCSMGCKVASSLTDTFFPGVSGTRGVSSTRVQSENVSDQYSRDQVCQTNKHSGKVRGHKESIVMRISRLNH